MDETLLKVDRIEIKGSGTMKKYIVFIFSFVLFYMLVQLLSGWVLTAFYMPDLSLTNSNLSDEVVFGQSSFLPLITSLTIATISYYLSQKLFVKNMK